MDILNNLLNIQAGSISKLTVLAVLASALALSIYEFLVYRFVSHRAFYNKSFNITIGIIPLFISTIILCLQSNIIITFGTIGVLAIIRFRTNVKDPVDMLYLLWSVYIGLVCGCKLFALGFITSLVATITLFALENLDFGKKPFVLILHSLNDLESYLVSTFDKYNVNYKIKSRNYTNKGYDYAIEFKTKSLNDFKLELANNKDISRYSIIEYDADDII